MKYLNTDTLSQSVAKKMNREEYDKFKEPVFPVNVFEKEAQLRRVIASLSKQGFTFIRT